MSKTHRAFCLLSLLSLVLSCADAETSCPETNTSIDLSRDQGPHDMLTEWWYTTGHLETEAGRAYGYELTIFQSWAAEQVGYVGHFAIIDPEAGEHIYAQNAIAPLDRYDSYDLKVGSWRIWGDGAADRFSADIPAEGIALSLHAENRKPTAFHNDTGLIDMGQDDSFYYSKTRMDIDGELTIDGQTQAVTGQGWLDHQWGDYAVFDCDGWDWFALQLDNGHEFMIFLLHDLDGTTRITGVTWVDEKGCVHALDDAQIVALDEWTSPHTGGVYPQNWRVDIPEAELSIEVTAAVEDQEMDCRYTTLNAYWEGLVLLEGEMAGQPVSGRGFVELAGYGPWGAGN